MIELVFSLGYVAYWHIAAYFNPDNFRRNPQDIFSQYAPEVNMLCFARESNLNISGFEKVLGPEDDWKKAVARIRQAQSS